MFPRSRPRRSAEVWVVRVGGGLVFQLDYNCRERDLLFLLHHTMRNVYFRKHGAPVNRRGSGPAARPEPSQAEPASHSPMLRTTCSLPLPPSQTHWADLISVPSSPPTSPPGPRTLRAGLLGPHARLSLNDGPDPLEVSAQPLAGTCVYTD